MKKYLLASLAAVVFASAAGATEVKPYVSLKGVYAKTTSTNFKYSGYDEDGTFSGKEKFSDSSYGARLAFGAKIDALRSELELGWNKEFSKNYSEVDEDEVDKWKDTFKTKTLMLNAYYDIFTKAGFTPYVGAGIGLSRINAKIEDVKASDTSFAWQAGLGVAYNITDNLALDLGYRYMNYGKANGKWSDDEEAGKVKARLKTNEVLFGLRYTF